MIVDPRSISFASIKADLNEYIQTMPQYNTWQDFLTSSTGTVIVDLISAMSCFLTYQVIVGRRETYLESANMWSSNVGIAQDKGYNVFRGQNPHITISFVPNVSVSIKPFDVIGIFKDYTIISLVTLNLQAGASVEVDVVIGNIYSEEVIAQTLLDLFIFTSEGMSEDIQLKLNGTVVAHSRILMDLNDDEFVALSNSLGGVNVMNLNRNGSIYTVSDTITVEYVKIAEIEQLTDSDFVLDYGTFASFSLLSTFLPPESVDSIKMRAPLYSETENVIRARKDYNKVLLLMDQRFIDTNGVDDESIPAKYHITYLLESLDLLSTLEKEILMEKIDLFRPFGIEPPTIHDPIEIAKKLSITIRKPADSTDSDIDIQNYVTTQIAGFEMELEKVINLYEVERACICGDLDFLVARVEIFREDFEVSTSYDVYSYVQPTISNDYIYEVTSSGTTGSSEPSWPTTPGETVISGGVIFTCREPDGNLVLDWKEYFLFEKEFTII